MEEKRKRVMLLNLSDEDMWALQRKAGLVELTPEQLLERFIFDLVGSSEADGEDSGKDAEIWFECSWFSVEQRKTLLCYLLNQAEHGWDIDNVMDWLCIVEDSEENIVALQEELDNGNYPWEEALNSEGKPMYRTLAEWEEDEKRFIEQERKAVARYRKLLINVWNEFCEWTDIEVGEMEAEFRNVLEWYKTNEKKIVS